MTLPNLFYYWAKVIFLRTFSIRGLRNIIGHLRNNIRMIVKRLQSRTKKIPTISDKDCFKSRGTFID